MKQILLIFIVAFTNLCNAQIVNIPDANFKAKLLAANANNSIASTQTPDITSSVQVNTFNKIDTNGDGEIQVTEAAAIKYLNVTNSSIPNMEGIEYFTNLLVLNCSYNLLTSLNVLALARLRQLRCDVNKLPSLDVSRITSLIELDCKYNKLISLNVSGLTNLENLYCEYNDFESLDVSGLTNLRKFECQANELISLGLNGLTNLQHFSCEFNQLPSLDVSRLTNLKVLTCYNNQLISLNVSGLLNLETLYCNYNQLPSLDVSGLTNLVSLKCSNNLLTSLNVTGISNIQQLYCQKNQLTSLNVSGLTNLMDLNCNTNQLVNLNVSGLINLLNLDCQRNQLPSLDVSGLTNLMDLNCKINNLIRLNVTGLTNLKVLTCNNNQLISLNVSGLPNLETFYCHFNQLPSLVVSGLPNLITLHCSDNQLTSLNVSRLPNLENLYCSYNQLPSLDVSGLPNLESLNCSDNQLSSLNVSGINNLKSLDCQRNQLTSLEVSGLTNLQFLYCYNNQLTSLDLSGLTNLQQLYCSDNRLIGLFIKNGYIEDKVSFHNNTNLAYICADEGQMQFVQDYLDDLGYTNCNIGTYCSFTPGGTFYSIRGNQKFDSNNNGCDSTDIIFPNFKYSITDGTNVGSFISDSSGTYNIPVQAGIQTITPIIENPTYFNFNPSTYNVGFPGTISPHIQDICITANGTHHDLEVLLIPMNVARPGFIAIYKLVYKNKGTSTQSGTIDFSFDDTVLDLVSSTPNFTSLSTGKLMWNFTNLLPFESREIIIVLKLNAPTATPPLNIGDILSYTVSINGQIDETPIDNIATLNQNVVNSFDPNDKTCLEGIRITPDKVGNYVHYLIRFENKGTANAQNIVVKDIIDTTKFDINTLIPIKASHNFETRISNINKVEFIFQDINLPFDDENNDGYVTFKIKTKPNLVLGDTFSNVANIYFDYNFPIVTNNFTTNIQNALGTQQNYIVNDINTYPNPVYNVLHFKTENKIIKVEVYDVLSRMISTNPVIDNKVDLSDLKNGSYILKLFTTKGVATTKIIKA